MYWETLPNWFWVIYYLILLTTIGAAIWSLLKRRMKGLSMIAIALAITVPIVSMLNSIGRGEGVDELEHLVSQLQQGAAWSVFVTVSYLFLAVYLVLILFKSRQSGREASK